MPNVVGEHDIQHGLCGRITGFALVFDGISTAWSALWSEPAHGGSIHIGEALCWGVLEQVVTISTYACIHKLNKCKTGTNGD